MKKIIQLFAFIFSVSVFACECGNWGKQFDSYSSSELVADVTITKVYPILKGEYSDKYFKIDLKYNEIYKGAPIKTMYVYGALHINNKFYGSFSSCSMGAKVGERLIIFESKDKEGNYILHYCDHKIYSNHKKFTESKSLLKFIKEKQIKTNIKYHYVNFGFDNNTGKDNFEIIKGLNATNKFAAFEITLTADGTFKNVDTIQNFGGGKDDLILEIIRKAKIYVNPNSNISDGEKFTLFMFYYPQDKNNLSFISQNFL